MASGIVKKCAVCGRIYEAYGVEDVSETEVEGNPENEGDILEDDSIEFVVFKIDQQHPGEVPTINGMQFLTISERMEIQEEGDIMDLCPACMAMHLALDTAIQNHQTPTKITGINTLTFTVSN